MCLVMKVLESDPKDRILPRRWCLLQLENEEDIITLTLRLIWLSGFSEAPTWYLICHITSTTLQCKVTLPYWTFLPPHQADLWPSQPSWESTTAAKNTTESYSSPMCRLTRGEVTTPTRACSHALRRDSTTSWWAWLCTDADSVRYWRMGRRWCRWITSTSQMCWATTVATWPASAASSGWSNKTKCGWICGARADTTSLQRRTTTQSSRGFV